MNYCEFMYGIKHDDDSVLNLPEVNIVDTIEPLDDNFSLSDILKGNTGGVIELLDKESYDDFFLGSDPYIPLY